MPECNLRVFPFILLLRLFMLMNAQLFQYHFYCGDCRVIGFNFICVRLRLEYRLYYYFSLFSFVVCCFACSQRLLLYLLLRIEHVERTFAVETEKSIFCHMDSDWLLPNKTDTQSKIQSRNMTAY